MDNNSIKKRITEFRLTKGIRQKELAERLGLSRNSYRALEKGGTRIIYEKLGELAQCLGCSEEELVLGYVPHEISPLELASSDNCARQLHELAQDYENRLEIARKQLQEKEEMIKALKGACESKDEIIELLHKSKY